MARDRREKPPGESDGRANIRRSIYPDLDRFWSDLVDCYVKEFRSLADVGCTHLQLDETSLVKLGDARVRAILRDRGDDCSDLLDQYIAAMNAIAERAPPGMKLAVHICRSQNPNWQARGGSGRVRVNAQEAHEVRFFNHARLTLSIHCRYKTGLQHRL